MLLVASRRWLSDSLFCRAHRKLLMEAPKPAAAASPQPPVYQYTPFADSQSIRILTLFAASSQDEPLRGSLSTEAIGPDKPSADFEAVSYVWGSRARTETLHCDDGCALPITRSIHDALRRLRRPDASRRLWADQVCINQRDVGERSQQVDLMNLIYRNATQVLVWLGPDDDGVARDAFAMIEHLQGVFADDEAHKDFKRAHSENLHQQDAAPWRPLAKMAMLPWVCPALHPCSEALLTAPVSSYLDCPGDWHQNTRHAILGRRKDRMGRALRSGGSAQPAVSSSTIAFLHWHTQHSLSVPEIRGAGRGHCRPVSSEGQFCIRAASRTAHACRGPTRSHLCISGAFFSPNESHNASPPGNGRQL